MANQPDDFKVMQCLQEILVSSDLTKLTRKEVRKQLEQRLQQNFSSAHWKTKIKQQIEDYVSKQPQVAAAAASASNHQYDANNAHVASNNNNGADYHHESIANPNKRRKLNNGTADSYLNLPSEHSHNNSNGPPAASNRKRVRLESNKSLIQKSLKDDSYYMKLPGDGAKKRCIFHKYRGRLYIGFREYYERGGEELPSKKGINLTQEQWEHVVRHIDDIQAQIQSMKR